MITWTLPGSGRRTHDHWSELHATAREWQATWADTSGLQLAPLPANPPATTHLWAWTTDQWLRIRIDAEHWWAALLTTNPAGELAHHNLWAAQETPSHGSVCLK